MRLVEVRHNRKPSDDGVIYARGDCCAIPGRDDRLGSGRRQRRRRRHGRGRIAGATAHAGDFVRHGGRHRPAHYICRNYYAAPKTCRPSVRGRRSVALGVLEDVA